MNQISGGKPANFDVMSATLLSQQPPIPKKTRKDNADWPRIYEHLQSSLQGMRMWRYSRWIYWADLAKYILPFRYQWLIVANRMWRDQPVNNAIIDNTGTQAMWVCASGLWTGLTNPARPWFKLAIGLPWVKLDREGKEWLEDTEQRLYVVMGQSNFYTQMAQAFQDVVTFGSAPLIINEDIEDVIRLYLPCAGEYYLGAGSRLSVDTLYREFTFTVAQCVEMFGLENCSQDIQKAWREGGTNWQSEYVICHAIEPNAALEPYGKFKRQVSVVSQRFAYREVYWVKGQSQDGELARKGYHERPFVVMRWKIVSNDPYGRALGEDALGDIKQLQLESVRKAEFLEKLVRPPMGADPAMQNQPASIIPGHVTYTDTSNGKKGFWPLLEVQPQALAPWVQDIDKIQTRIKDTFFVNVFMAISQMQGVQPRNELELTKRDQERLQMLGPFITLFETECASPAIARILAIMERRRMLKPMPQSLRGVPIKIDYKSILRLAQSSAQTVAIKDFLAVGGSMSQAAKAAALPDPLRIVNLDEAYRKYGDLSAIDPHIVYTEQEVKEHDAARAQVQSQQQAAGAIAPMVQAAKGLSETSLDGNTALGAILGGTRPLGV